MAVAVAVAQVCNVVATTTITLAGRLKLSFPSFSFMQLKRRWKVTLAFSFAGCEKIACNTFKKREYALKRKPFGRRPLSNASEEKLFTLEQVSDS